MDVHFEWILILFLNSYYYHLWNLSPDIFAYYFMASFWMLRMTLHWEIIHLALNIVVSLVPSNYFNINTSKNLPFNKKIK